MSSYKIIFPKGGLFIAIEWLIIDDNEYEFKYTNPKGIKKLDGVVYFPSLGTIPENTNNNAWAYSKGRWSKNKKLLKGKYTPQKYVNKFPVLACELTLTN